MIDIHCHILPGVDDGAADEQVSIEMGRAAMLEGITQIVATPHHRNRSWDNPRSSTLKMVATLNQLFDKHNITVTILPGQEPRIFGEMADDGIEEELVTVNDGHKYLLVEFPTHHVPRYAQRLFYDLQMKGVTPVIVHPERNNDIFTHPDILYQLINDGALSQVTAASLIGRNGKKVKKFVSQLIDNGLTHFIASDAHNVGERPFYMKEAFAELDRLFGRAAVKTFQENAELLIHGELVNREQPEPIREKKFLGIF